MEEHHAGRLVRSDVRLWSDCSPVLLLLLLISGGGWPWGGVCYHNYPRTLSSPLSSSLTTAQSKHRASKERQYYVLSLMQIA